MGPALGIARGSAWTPCGDQVGLPFGEVVRQGLVATLRRTAAKLELGAGDGVGAGEGKVSGVGSWSPVID